MAKAANKCGCPKGAVKSKGRCYRRKKSGGKGKRVAAKKC